MKRFKIIFHVLYILITLILIYFSVDILMNTEDYLSKIKLSSYIKFPKYVMSLLLFISILMAVEYVMQQLRINNIKQGIGELQDEIVALKAKLYDKGEGNLLEEETESDSEDDQEEEEEEVDDER